jgi:hypothetical protein
MDPDEVSFPEIITELTRLRIPHPLKYALDILKVQDLKYEPDLEAQRLLESELHKRFLALTDKPKIIAQLQLTPIFEELKSNDMPFEYVLKVFGEKEGKIGAMRELFQKSAKRGDLMVQLMEPVTNYYRGLGLFAKEEYKASIKYFTRAANKDHPRARFVLGYMYQYGVGINLYGRLAATYLNKSSTFAPEQYCFSQLERMGNVGIISDSSNYMEALKKSVNQGFAPAQYEWAQLFSSPWKTSYKWQQYVDVKQCTELIHCAAKQGYKGPDDFQKYMFEVITKGWTFPNEYPIISDRPERQCYIKRSSHELHFDVLDCPPCGMNLTMHGIIVAMELDAWQFTLPENIELATLTSLEPIPITFRPKNEHQTRIIVISNGQKMGGELRIDRDGYITIRPFHHNVFRGVIGFKSVITMW